MNIKEQLKRANPNMSVISHVAQNANTAPNPKTFFFNIEVIYYYFALKSLILLYWP